MEINLNEWYQKRVKEGKSVKPEDIKTKALQLSRNDDFLASKGWLMKFKQRYNIKFTKENYK